MKDGNCKQKRKSSDHLLKRGSGLYLTKGRYIGNKLEVAKNLRSKMTPAEKYFWNHVRRRQYRGYRFRRNHPIGGFIVDFYCDALRLVIELDGEIHQKTKEYDQERDQVLRGFGVRVMRFSNKEIFFQLPKVMQRIFSPPALRAPSPKGEGKSTT